MKFYGYILSFYLLLLAVIPCCVFDNCPDEKTVSTSPQKAGDEDCGSCSPFFNCDGCATATIASEPAPEASAPVKNSPEYNSYIQQILPRIEYDFWQPPKIG